MPKTKTLDIKTLEPDWEERTTAALLIAARRSGFFDSAIDDAKHFQSEGYSWVNALKLSCNYWCS